MHVHTYNTGSTHSKIIFIFSPYYNKTMSFWVCFITILTLYIYIYIFYLFSLTSAVVVLPSFSIHSPSPHLLLSIIPLFLCCYFSLSLSLSLSIVPGLPFSYSLLMTFLSYFSMFSNYIHDFDFWLLIFWCLVFGCWENMRKQREIGFFFFFNIYFYLFF